MRVYVSEHNKNEGTLKRELESLKKQLDQSVKQKQERQKSMITQKLDFSEKGNKTLK